MKANVILPEIREGTEKDVKVDASSVPDVEWRGICAVLLPAIRVFYGLDDEKGGDNNGCNTRGGLESEG